MESSVFQWITATITVLVLVLAMGRLARWALERSTPSGGAASQLASWRLAPDARVRAVRVLDRVHLVYERGKDNLLLESVPEPEFERRQKEYASASPSILPLRPRRRNRGVATP